MIDVVHQINAVHREVAASGEARVVTIRQSYDASVEDVWSACTDAERIPRWFLPVSGELRLGGRYQLEGNAGGTITACEPPHRFEATWEFGETVSWIAVSVDAVDGSDERTQLTIEHTVPVDDHWAQFGPGAVGVGWDMALIGMALHLASGGAPVDREAVGEWMASEDARGFIERSSSSWGDAHAAAAVTTDEDAGAQATRTTAAYTGTA